MTARKNIKKLKGFTLIELLVVIGILAVLLAITLIAINPGRQFAQANNTKRSSDVNAILNAVHQYAVDNNGTLPSSITASVQDVANTAANICADLVPTYIAALPSDPQTGTPVPGANITSCGGAYNTAYTIVAGSSPNNRVTVAAPDAELAETISVQR